MALTPAQLRKKYGRDLRQRLRSKLVMAQLCNTNFRGDVVNSREVEIISPKENLRDPSDSSLVNVDDTTAEEGRNPTFDAPMELENESRVLVMDQGSQLGVSLGVDDLNEATFDMIADANDKISRRMSFEIDSNLSSYMRQQVPGARAANNRQKPAAIGDATDYITRATGIPSSADAREYLVAAFLDASAWALGSKIWKVGQIEHTLWCTMHPLLWRAFQEWVLKDKPTDALVNVFGGGPRSRLGINTSGQVQGGMAEVQVFLNPEQPFETVGGKNHWTLLFGTRQYCTLAARPVLYSDKPVGQYQANETIGAVVHGFQRYGRLVVNPEQAYSVAIRAEA